MGRPEGHAIVELIPPGFTQLRARSAIVLPVCYGDAPLGVAVFSAETKSGQLCEMLAEAFGVGMKSVRIRRKAK